MLFVANLRSNWQRLKLCKYWDAAQQKKLQVTPCNGSWIDISMLNPGRERWIIVFVFVDKTLNSHSASQHSSCFLDRVKAPYNKVLGITNNFPGPSNNSKIYGKEPWYNETLLKRIYFASPLVLCYMEVPQFLRTECY